jgi:hypothetical protein
MTGKPNMYINPNAPTWLKKMLPEELFPHANKVSRAEMQAKIEKLSQRAR